MKKKNLKKVASAVLALTMLVPGALPVYAEEPEVPAEPAWKTGVKDHWSFEAGATSDQGTQGVLHDITVEDTKNAVFGKALKFGAGANKYMRLENYINTGTGKTSFSMWYKYDTSITDNPANVSTVLLQHEDKNASTIGRSLLSLKNDGKYETFINGQPAAASEQSVQKGDWQHVTVVFDQEAKKVQYYINGEPDGEAKTIGNSATNADLTLRVGAHKTADMKDPHPMRGYIDELYVYNRALSNEEAKSLYEDKAAELYKVELGALIAEAEELVQGSGLPDTDPLLSALKSAIDEARTAVEASNMDTLKSAKETLGNAINAYKAEQPIDLTINTENVTQNIDADSIFGINHRYAFNGYGTFDSENMKMKDEFVALYKDAGFGSIRYPGGTISNLFNWKTTLGPKDQRKKQMHGFYNNPNQGGIAPNFGIGEIATFADNVDSEVVYVYSLGQGSVQDAADLVEYLNAEVGTNPNEGIDWAEVRSRNGHPEPYNVRYFEIGNEMNQGGEDGRASQQYWTAYVDGGAENAYIDGGVARFNQRYTVKEEDWNKVASRSDGSANQVRYLMYANVNPGKLNEEGKIVVDPEFKAVEPGVEITVGTDGNTVPWTVVEDLRESGSTDRHCEVDYSTGAIKFGDGVHGKIPEAGNNIYATYSVRRDGFTAISKAIKDTTAKINKKEDKKYAAHVYTSFESETFFQKMADREKEDLCDGMTIHPYSGDVAGGNNADTFYDNAMKKAETGGIGKVTHLMQFMPEGKVPVISEYGIFRNTERQLRSQTHAIYIAKVLMEYVRLGSPYIQKHCLTDWYSTGADALGPTQQAVIQVAGGTDEDRKTGDSNAFTFFSTPSAHVFKMLNSGFGDNIVETRFSEVPEMANGVETLSTLASMDESGNLYVAIVNADRENDRKIALKINGVDVTGRKMNVQRLESETITDENTPEDKDKVTVTKDEEIELTGNPVINLKKHSFAIVRIETDEIVADKSELQEAVDSVESLIKDHYTNFETIEDELAAAEAVLANGKATQAQVEEALTNLRAARAGLVMKDADYSKVDAAIAKAEKLNKEDYKDFSKVEEAIDAVVRGKKIDEQAAVDAMAQEIEAAIAALEKVEVPGKPEKPENPEKPGKPEKPEKPEKPSGNKVPVTGDETTPILWMTLVVMAGAAITIVGKKFSKKN